MSRTNKIVGRDEELETLNEFFSSDKAEFLILHGRRRIGKTYLIRNYFENKKCCFFYAVGIYKESIERQIKEFTTEIERIFYNNIELKEKNNWFDTFALLSEAIEKQVSRNKKIILFFDEFPWMATHRSKLLQGLEYYWNKYWSHDKRIKLIICGSAASWITKNIINNKGGLHNRLTRIIRLEPMSLLQTKRFLDHMNVKLNNQHIANIYMVTGGVPYYLSHITTVASAAKIIDKLAFSKNSFLLSEFENLYASLFGEEIYFELVRIIADKRYGMSQREIFNKIGENTKGGTIVKKLKELESAGFIISFKPYKHNKKGIYYRIIDEYTLFYFSWIEPIKDSLSTNGMQKGYWEEIQKSAAWHSWAGLSFEAICYKHINQIKKALSLNSTSIPATWRYNPTKKSIAQGAQVDLLFDNNDNSITIGEIKCTDQQFAIDKSYAQKLQQKIDVFKKITKTKKQIFLVVISLNGIKKTIYSEELISDVVTLDDLFS